MSDAVYLEDKSCGDRRGCVENVGDAEVDGGLRLGHQSRPSHVVERALQQDVRSGFQRCRIASTKRR